MKRFYLPDTNDLPALLAAGAAALQDQGVSPEEIALQQGRAGQTIEALRQGTVKFVTMPVLNSRTGEELFAEILLRLFNREGVPLPVFDHLMAIQDFSLFPYIMPHLLFKQLEYVRIYARHTSINVPPALLIDAENQQHVDAVLRAYEAAGGKPAHVILEITETAYLPATDALVAFMHTLKKRGYRWALDDYGDGHHTLEHVRTLPLDFVKLSQLLVEAFLSANPPAQEELLKLCKDRGLTLIAEHTPTAADAEKLFQDFGIIYINLEAPSALPPM